MNFIKQINATDTDMQIGLCNQSIIVRKDSVSFFSDNLELKTHNPRGFTSSMGFKELMTGGQFFKVTPKDDGIGYILLSSVSTPKISTFTTKAFTHYSPQKLTLMPISQLEGLYINHQRVLGFTAGLEPAKREILKTTDNFDFNRFMEGRVRLERPQQLPKIVVSLKTDLKPNKHFGEEEIGELERIKEKVLRQGLRKEENLFVILMTDGDLITKTLKEGEKMRVRKGVVVAHDATLENFSKGDKDFNLVKGPCRLLISTRTRNVIQASNSNFCKYLFIFLLVNFLLGMLFTPMFVEQIMDMINNQIQLN